MHDQDKATAAQVGTAAAIFLMIKLANDKLIKKNGDIQNIFH